MQSTEILLPAFAVAYLLAGVVAFVSTPGVRRLAIAWGAIDVPDARKIHTAPVPRLGGIAVALSVAVATVVALLEVPGLRGHLVSAPTLGLTGAALSIAILGAVDDVRGVGHWVKLAVEIIAASVVVWLVGAPETLRLGAASGGMPLGAFGPVLAVLWIVIVTNGVNLLDVADGVASGTGLLSAVGLGLAAIAIGHTTTAVMLLALAGSLTGFLPHNLRASHVFLGDSGSLLVGFLLGAGALVGLTRDNTWAAVPAVLALGLPLSEVALTVMRRVLRSLTVVRPTQRHAGFLLGRAKPGLFVPDRRHIPHRLVELGLSRRAALFTLWAVALGLAVLSWMTAWWPRAGLMPVLVAAAGLLYAAPRWLYEELRVLDRGALLPLLETRWLHNRMAHVVYDGLAVALSLWLAKSLARGDGPTPAELAVVMVSTLVTFRVAGLYRGSYRQASLAEVARAVRAAIVGGVAGLAVLLAVFGRLGDPVVWPLYLYFLATAVVGARVSFRILEFIYLRKVPNARRAVIVGADHGGLAALAEMLANPGLGFQPTGFLDAEPGRVGGRFHGYPVYELSERGVAQALRALVAREVVVPHGSIDANAVTQLQTWSRDGGASWVQFGSSWGDVADAASPRGQPVHADAGVVEVEVAGTSPSRDPAPVAS